MNCIVEFQNAIAHRIKDVGSYVNKTKEEKITINSLALVGEAGEIANKIKKHIWYSPQERQVLSNDIGEELGDVMYHAVQLATELGISMDTILKGCLTKIKNEVREKILQLRRTRNEGGSMSKLLYLDLETTGLYPWKNAVVQISGEVEIDGVTQEKFNLLVKPFKGAVIEDTALKVNGRTREELNTFDSPKTIFMQFQGMLEKYVNKWSKTDKFFMVGYNSHSFDSQFLREFFKKNGEKYYGSYFWSAGHDVMLLAAYKLAEERHKMKDFKLLTVARQLGIEVDESRLHDAEYDIEITKAMYKEVIK